MAKLFTPRAKGFWLFQNPSIHIFAGSLYCIHFAPLCKDRSITVMSFGPKNNWLLSRLFVKHIFLVWWKSNKNRASGHTWFRRGSSRRLWRRLLRPQWWLSACQVNGVTVGGTVLVLRRRVLVANRLVVVSNDANLLSWYLDEPQFIFHHLDSLWLWQWVSRQLWACVCWQCPGLITNAFYNPGSMHALTQGLNRLLSSVS